MSESSLVEIEYEMTANTGDFVDLTNHAVSAHATFDSASSANPGEAEIELRDPDRNLPAFVAGHRLRLKVDHQQLWSGFYMKGGRGNFLPAGDARAETRSRKITLHGVDNNILFDHRVLRDPSNYLRHLPYVVTDLYDGAIIRYALANFVDMPSFVNIVDHIDDVVVPASNEAGHITATAPWEYPEQGSKLRALFEDLGAFSVYYIGPDDAVHFHAFQSQECPWGFSDRPNYLPLEPGVSGFQGSYWGFRDLDAAEDGYQLATDAFVWGGSEFAGSGTTVFKRATDPDLELAHGKWQYPETHFGERYYRLQKGVDVRANMIVFGNAAGDPSGAEPGSVAGEGPRGLRFSQWNYSFGWSVRNVPVLDGTPRHLYPGDVVPIQLWSFSADGGVTPFTKFLPLRSLRVSFAGNREDGTSVVRFQGGFDLRNEDSKFLWKYLRAKEKAPAVSILVIDDSSTSSTYGGYGKFVPTPLADGDVTVFVTKFGYVAGTTQVFINGILQTPGVDYNETQPAAGEITFTVAPASGTALYVTCRTLDG